MFEVPLRETPLTSPMANAYFYGSIDCWGTVFNRDTSINATLRALLYDKVTEENPFHCRLDKVETSQVSEIAGRFSEYILENYQLIVINNTFYRPIFKNEDSVQMILDRLPGFTYVKKLTDLFKKNFEAYAFVNEEKRVTCLYSACDSYAQWHYLQCGLVGILPWYITSQTLLDDTNKKDLVYSLSKKEQTDYLNCLSLVAEKFDFKATYIRKQLGGFERRYAEQEIKDVERKILESTDRIKECLAAAASIQVDIRNLQIRYDGLTMSIQNDSSNSEIMEYFLANKSLDLVSVDDLVLKFSVHGYLEFWDPDMAENYIENHGSYFYTNTHGLSDEDVEMLLRAIFIDQTIKLRICAAYSMDLKRYVLNPLTAFMFTDYNKMMANPHINRYGCIGNFDQVFEEAMIRGDYVYGIEQCIVSAKSLSLADSIVMREFMSSLYGYSNTEYINDAIHCLETPDGIMDYREAIVWLKSQKEGANE